MKTVDEVMELTRELSGKGFQEEVRDFARFLVEKRARPTRKKLRLDWAGGLKDLRDKYTSVRTPTQGPRNGGTNDALGRR